MPSRHPAGIRGRFAHACAAIVAGAIATGPSQAHASAPHVVQAGETLWSIAYANNLTTRTVAAFNGLSEDAAVVEGQTINVPTVDEGAAALASVGVDTSTSAPATAGGGGHVVQPGESLWSVAIANGISVESLAATNGIAADSFLITGQTITVPGSASGTSGGGGGHVVQPGESLSSVALANGISIDALAAANGLAADSFLIEGQTIAIPAGSSSSTVGLGHVPSPYGELHLDPAAADSWNSMRADSLNNYGVDLYPGGPASAYRTTEQQQELYDLYLSGQGAPANPPGTSVHETGRAVDVAEPVMRDVIDQIGGSYGWSGTIPSEWWHVEYGW